MKPAVTSLMETVRQQSRRWLVTGAAGFIGSNLVEFLLSAGQQVIALDNFATGHQHNIDDVLATVAPAARDRFTLIRGDIRDRACCAQAIRGVDIVLHQAAIGSVPRSIADPLASHDANVTGFLNMLDAGRQAGVARFVYASSSSIYGDEPNLPKREECIGQPLSPYAVTKLVNEIYAAVYQRAYGFKATGLRYFNVFGPRQDPNGAYAAVIPKWINAMIRGEQITINGDGHTSRDFCYIANALQANIRAALAPETAQGEVYNVAVGERLSLLDLFYLIQNGLSKHQLHYEVEPYMNDFRPNDVRHSQADIRKAQQHLDYHPTHTVAEGMFEALPFYLRS